VKRAVVAPALLFVLASGLDAQQPTATTAEQPVFRSAAQLVPLSITVMDKDNHFVKGLTAADFAVFEDGVPQQVQFFESSSVPLDLIIMLDISSSMSDKMDVVHEAAVGFVKTLRDVDRGAVITFADAVDVAQVFTSDHAALEQAIRRTTARGATSLHNALYIALKEFGKAASRQREIRRQAIAVLSDGDDTASLLSFDDVLALARKSGVCIYPIALQSKQAASRMAAGQRRYFSESEYSMRTLAQETGAQAFFPLQVVELKGIYGSIAEELSNQYSLAYAPINALPDGRFRRISVRIASRPELRLRTRTGYTAQAASTGAGASASQFR
jgi:Ca-activated chloride channel homolog